MPGCLAGTLNSTRSLKLPEETAKVSTLVNALQPLNTVVNFPNFEAFAAV